MTKRKKTAPLNSIIGNGKYTCGCEVWTTIQGNLGITWCRTHVHTLAMLDFIRDVAGARSPNRWRTIQEQARAILRDAG